MFGLPMRWPLSHMYGLFIMNFVSGLSQFLSTGRTLGTIVFTVHADRLGFFIVTTGQY